MRDSTKAATNWIVILKDVMSEIPSLPSSLPARERTVPANSAGTRASHSRLVEGVVPGDRPRRVQARRALHTLTLGSAHRCRPVRSCEYQIQIQRPPISSRRVIGCVSRSPPWTGPPHRRHDRGRRIHPLSRVEARTVNAQQSTMTESVPRTCCLLLLPVIRSR